MRSKPQSPKEAYQKEKGKYNRKKTMKKIDDGNNKKILGRLY